MNGKAVTALAAVAVVVAVPILVFAFPNPVLSPLAYLDHRACLHVEPGMSEGEVLDLMGEPRGRIAREDGRTILGYRRQQLESGPIEVELKASKSGTVVSHVDCVGRG